MQYYTFILEALLSYSLESTGIEGWEDGYKIQNKAWLSQQGLSSAWPLLPPNSWKLVSHYLGLVVLPAGRLALLKLRIDMGLGGWMEVVGWLDEMQNKVKLSFSWVFRLLG